MTGPHELLFGYYLRATNEADELRERVIALEKRMAWIEREHEDLLEKYAERKRLLRLWTEKTYRARKGRDMWRTRALDAHGTKRRIRSTS